MPSLATAQPTYPRKLDRRDSVDQHDRQLESITASVALASGAVAGLRNPLNTGVASTSVDLQAGLYFMPSTIPAASRGTYETLVNTLYGTPAVLTVVRTANTIATDATQTWVVNAFAGLYLKAYVNTDPTEFSLSPIVSNTATAITVSGNNLLANANRAEIFAPTGLAGTGVVLAKIQALKPAPNNG
jgi:hypothetical protein